MIVVATAEARWFYPGEIPDSVRAWYQSLTGEVQQQPVRTDYYLPVWETDGLNIKYREGRVEIKQRYRSPEPIRLDESITGMIELWKKWGFELTEEHNAGTFDDLVAWIAVRKSRLMRNYEVRADDVAPIPAEARRDQSCSVELTRVQVQDAIWWTFALEAVGPEHALVTSLRTTAQHVLVGSSEPQLQAKAACGYPGWLLRVTAASMADREQSCHHH